MAEKLMDQADRKLEFLFRSTPVKDDGFSINVVKRVRRQMWIQRLSMPVAIAIGVLIAAKPLVQLVSVVPNLLTVVPASIGNTVKMQGFIPENLPQLSTILIGMMLLGAVLMLTQMLEE